MQSLLSIRCQSASAASDYQAQAEAGSLWGVSLGTTAHARAVGAHIVIRCTPTRGSALLGASPEAGAVLSTVPTASEMSAEESAFYALGLMDA